MKNPATATSPRATYRQILSSHGAHGCLTAYRTDTDTAHVREVGAWIDSICGPDVHIAPVSDRDGPIPLYYRYPEQDSPQGAYIDINSDTKTVGVGWNGEIGNAVPVDVYEGTVRRFEIQPEFTATEIECLLAQVSGGVAEYLAADGIDGDELIDDIITRFGDPETEVWDARYADISMWDTMDMLVKYKGYASDAMIADIADEKIFVFGLERHFREQLDLIQAVIDAADERKIVVCVPHQLPAYVITDEFGEEDFEDMHTHHTIRTVEEFLQLCDCVDPRVGGQARHQATKIYRRLIELLEYSM